MIAEKAFLELYPNAELGSYKFSLKYSAKFNDYNANVKKIGNNILFSLSRKWKNINDDVKIGLIQSLLNKMLNTKIETPNIKLYEIFIKKVHISIPKIKSDTILEESFNRVNEKYFNGLIEKPNLIWGSESLNKLGSYEYGSDTIRISRIFLKTDKILLDYVMYHEMLHKKHKFYTKSSRSYHHTKDFSREEKLFENYKEADKMIKEYIKKEIFKK